MNSTSHLLSATVHMIFVFFIFFRFVAAKIQRKVSYICVQIKIHLNMSLIFMAILPAVLLFIYIYRQDTYKEPLNLLIWTFILGMLSAPFSSFFCNLTPESVEAGPFVSAMYTAFLKAAVPEELAKFIMLYALIWNNRNFDEFFDGIVYASIIGLGFAALENIMYVISYGPSVVVSRGLLAVPGHFFFGVSMGFFFALAKFYPKQRFLYFTLTLAVPMILHGIYDGLLMWAENLNSWISIILTLVFYCFVFRMWKLGIKKIKMLQGV